MYLAVGRWGLGLDYMTRKNLSKAVISLILRKPMNFTNTWTFLLHSYGILEMLRVENYSLFFVLAHTVTLRRSLRTIIIMTTTPLCPKTKLKWPVANSKSQATTLLVTIRQWLHFPVTPNPTTPVSKYQLFISFKMGCHSLLQRWRLWISSKKLLS